MQSESKDSSFHKRNAKIECEDFKKRMRNLRNGDYLARLEKVRDGLNFKGEMSDVELKVLFIRAAEKFFSKEAPLEESIKRDIFLMSLGLLKGFSQYKNKNKCRLEFLQKSNYIAVYDRGKYASYDENRFTETEKNRMAETLRKAEGRAIDAIAGILYSKGDCNEYSKSLSEYYECKIKNEKSIPDSQLPSLRHPRSSANINMDSVENTELSEESTTSQDINKAGISDVKILPSIEDDNVLVEQGNTTLPAETTEDYEEENEKEKEKTKPEWVRFLKIIYKGLCIFFDRLFKKPVSSAGSAFIASIITFILVFWQGQSNNVDGQLFLFEPISKPTGKIAEIHLNPDEGISYRMAICPEKFDANNIKIKILDSNVAELTLDPSPPPALNQRYMDITAQKEWDEKNHKTKIIFRGKNFNDEKIPIIVDKPDTSTSNEEEPMISGTYEGDEGSRQENKPTS